MSKIRDLNERQVQCLRLVADGVTSSKAIADRTALSPSSIDNYLSRAAVTLGVQGREAAAARYQALELAAEQSSVSGSVYRFPRLVGLAKSAMKAIAAGIRWLFSVPPLGGRKHDLNRTEIIFSILKVAAVSFTVFLVLVLSGAGLLWLLRGS